LGFEKFIKQLNRACDLGIVRLGNNADIGKLAHECSMSLIFFKATMDLALTPWAPGQAVPHLDMFRVDCNDSLALYSIEC